ncbi:hypothetical protein [Streptomyces griseofuscus]|uniref:hypothetical protein n=1 Tax=Streptomyces griseofuscus TaxID=146922 RepID=UPI003F4D9969
MEQSRAQAELIARVDELTVRAQVIVGRCLPVVELLLRSGLLRQPAAGVVDFLRRTFQDCGARYAVEEGHLDVLLKNADDTQREDVVRMAVVHARPMNGPGCWSSCWSGGPPRLTLYATEVLHQLNTGDDDARHPVGHLRPHRFRHSSSIRRAARTVAARPHTAWSGFPFCRSTHRWNTRPSAELLVLTDLHLNGRIVREYSRSLTRMPELPRIEALEVRMPAGDEDFSPLVSRLPGLRSVTPSSPPGHFLSASRCRELFPNARLTVEEN